MDFTLKKYRKLLEALIAQRFKIITYEEYLSAPQKDKFVILRHDVDELANHALKIARLEKELGLRATYYFRMVKQSNNPDIIREIAAMGHEIGYHYEDLALANGDYELAIRKFEDNLNYFRRYYPIRTVCMHGSSTSKYDNRLLWKNYSLEDYGLIGEPYLTTDFDKVYYLTDTGYGWDGGKYAVRDVVENHFNLVFHHTDQVIRCINEGKFPHQCMVLAHTLWTDNYISWCFLHLREFLRNHIKRIARNNRLISVLYNEIVKLYWRYPSLLKKNEKC